MSQIQIKDNQIIVKGNSLFLYICLGAAFMAFLGGSLLFEILPFREEHGTEDIFGVAFMFAWVSIVLWMGFTALSNYKRKIIIDETGVSCGSLLKNRHFDWSEIKDYGLSYSGQVRGGGNTYDLYFSKKEQKKINNCKKRLRQDVIKICIFGDDYRIASETVIPYCEKYATEPSFVGEDTYHFM